MRLRGETPTVFGYYDMARGNEAAVLADRVYQEAFDLFWKTQMDGKTPESEEAADTFDALCTKLSTLAQMAGGTWTRNP